MSRTRPVNPYAETAAFRLGGVHEWQVEEGSTDATNLAAALDAIASATLALAYEQRTANLIAYITGSYPNGQGIYAGGDAHSQVIARLGMRESEGPF